MRENIGLFRGKRIDNGEWIEGCLLSYEDGRARICVGHTNIFCYEKDRSLIQTVAHEVIPETVGECTGLKDKNGKLIFEGDIIGTDLKRPYVIVEYRDACFMFNCNDGGKNYYDIFMPILDTPHTVYEYGEIIGNIHDNPELLKEGADNA